MHVFEMVVWIVVVACLAGVIKEYLKTKRHSGNGSEDLEDALDRIDELEERIRVLETVVTDDRYQLDREIDKLKGS